MRIDLDELERLAKAATPQNIDAAEIIEGDEGKTIECPACSGEGYVSLEGDYCNFDGCAIGVQFYGVGNEHGAAERYYRAANPATVLELVRRLREAESTTDQIGKVYRAESGTGQCCHFGDKAAAIAWSGTHGTVKEIDLDAISPVEAPAAEIVPLKVVPCVGHARQQETPIKFFCHSEDAGYNEFDTLAEAAACAESMLSDARSNANLDGEWSEEETSIRYGSVIGEAVEIKQEGGGYEYSISKPSATPCQGHAQQQEVEEIERLRKDAERLNWLDTTNKRFRMGWHAGIAPVGNVMISSVVMSTTDIRSAIDSAKADQEAKSGD